MQTYEPEARALRGDGMKRACPTWHGGIAHQPTAYNPVKHIAYGVGIEGCFTPERREVRVPSRRTAASIPRASEKRTFTSDLYYGSITAFDTVNHKVVAKAMTDIEIRSGAMDTAGGVVFTALQDGWVVAYNDETLRGAVALQRRHAAQGRAGHLRDRTEAVSRGADERPASASGEIRQSGKLELPVRVRAELRPARLARSEARASNLLPGRWMLALLA